MNPNLALGVLYFEDAWFHWRILQGFMTPDAPVTGWNEQTYAGYKLGGPEGVDTYRERWANHSLNGEFLPGIAAIAPWQQMTEIEKALRDNGHLWVYQQAGYTPDHQATLGFVNRYFLFNRSGPNPLPMFDLPPGIDARPYRGPEGKVSCLLNTFIRGTVPPSGFTIITESTEIEYAGFNLTRRILEGPNPTLRAEDFPCILYGLEETALELTRIWAIIEEVDHLIEFYEGLGLGEVVSIKVAVDQATEDFRAGRYGEAGTKANAAREEIIRILEATVWPLLDEGIANPRQSRIPLNLLNLLSSARMHISKDEVPTGESYLYEGLKKWYLSVSEPLCLAFTVLLLLSIGINAGRDQKSLGA